MPSSWIRSECETVRVPSMRECESITRCVQVITEAPLAIGWERHQSGTANSGWHLLEAARADPTFEQPYRKAGLGDQRLRIVELAISVSWTNHREVVGVLWGGVTFLHPGPTVVGLLRRPSEAWLQLRRHARGGAPHLMERLIAVSCLVSHLHHPEGPADHARLCG
jgi:hypothetical protein